MDYLKNGSNDFVLMANKDETDDWKCSRVLEKSGSRLMDHFPMIPDSQFWVHGIISEST